MVYRNSNSSLDEEEDAVSVLNRERVVVVEEFPRVVERTEIVRVEEVKTANVECFSFPSSAAVATATTATGSRDITIKCLSDRQEVQRQQQQQHNHRKSGRFSLFNWFKKGNDFEGEDKLTGNKRDSQKIIYSSSGSVDTTCSTATVHSFTFRSGNDINERKRGKHQYFRKHSSADNFAIYPTQRSCGIGQFDSDPLFINRESCMNGEKNEELIQSVEKPGGIDTEVRKKDPIKVRSEKNINEKHNNDKSELYNFYRSLPTAGKTADLTNNNKKRYSHVRGKRPAPKPPVNNNSIDSNNRRHYKEEKINTARRKRQAPKPPVDKVEKETEKCDVTKNKASESFDEKRNFSAIINDTLKLEGGILLPRKSDDKIDATMNQVFNNKQENAIENGAKKGQAASVGNTVLPRPWYKRSNTTLSERDICGSFRREVLKIPTLSKSSRIDKGARFSLHHESPDNMTLESTSNSNSSEIHSFDKSFSRLNHLFGRSDACKMKKDEKRKSNLNILTNISELDREAAAIVQEEQIRNQAIQAKSNPSQDINDFGKTPSGDIISEIVSGSIEPQRRGTRALISKFNAISNITKVTVNATFFAKSSPISQNKIDVVRGAGDRRSNGNNRNVLVTKRLICDGTERVNETGADISSINFFRRLEAEASKIPENNSTNPIAAPGWEEKIKRYFPEKVTPGKSADDKSERNYFHKRRELGNLDRSFELHDNRNVDKIEHLSRADLKEMLIEMKHSLPKRPKPKPSGSSVAKSIANNNNEKVLNPRKSTQSSELVEDKLSTSKATASNRLSKIETRTRNVAKLEKREDEKRILSVTETNNKTKVSSAAQTSANLRKIESQVPKERQRGSVEVSRYKPGGKISENTIYTMKGRKNAGGGAALTRNTFQLIRPRDFACIEALKTEKDGRVSGEAQNTYMNVIEDSIYANTVINPNPPIIHADEKLAKKIETGGNKVDDDNGKNIIPINDKAGNSKTHELEPWKPEIRVLGSEGNGGERDNPGSEKNMNTMAINRLLRKLEGAIASGQHQQAAGLAKELAQLKIHCSVVRQRSGNNKASDFINVDMYIEDKLAHQGPIPLQLSLNMTVAQLKNKVFAEFEIPANVQRWIIGKNLADNDDFTINDLKAVDKSSIFLYLVAPDLQNDECGRVDKPVVKEEEVIEANADKEMLEIVPVLEEEPEVIPEEPMEPTVEELKIQRYEHLMSLENSDVIPNSVPIECPICFAPYGPCEGVILRDCLHMFCRTCIANTIMYCEEAEVKCPFRDSEYTCESTLQEREIKALVTPEIYEQHLAKSVSQAENNAGNNAFHCKTPDCRGWCIYDDNVNIFLCPVCGVNNCLTCQAIHTNKNCREYQDEIRLLKETDQETKRTAAVLEEMVESGEALACPTCAVVLMKKWGCDWLRCSMCKTEICWVTRGPRWGPGGKGDTSGGCKCGENGVKCHPRCNYCH